ncbi:MAG: TrmH family RNA methyltransferase [Alphaproteobacteria bacterium]
MRRLVEESCDATVKLPMNEKVESLNVATAAAQSYFMK